MEIIKRLFFLSLISFAALAAEVKPVQLLPVKKIFDTEIKNPKALLLCQNILWTYSEKEKQIIGMSSNKGDVLIRSQLGFPLQDLACRQDQVLVLSAEKAKQQIYLQTRNQNKLSWQVVATPAFHSWMSRLSCKGQQCWLAAKQIYHSTDLKKWIADKIPPATDLKRVGHNPQKNPFDDWQSSLNMAETSYRDFAIDRANHVTALDPFHAQIVQQTEGQWHKWGQYGIWEGSLLNPKRIQFISDRLMVVADNGLKGLFLFTREGKYLGTLSTEKNFILGLDIISGMDSIQGRLFVADFYKNKVMALDLQSVENLNPDSDEVQIRQNLFRQHAAQQDYTAPICLNCHDGTAINSLHVFSQTQNKHPISCTACHDQHHLSKEKHNLNKPEQILCLACHAQNAMPETNHIWKHGKKGGTCLDCHSSHSGNMNLLVQQPPQLCMNCHKTQNIAHREVKDLLQNNRAKGMHFTDGKISCLTCHETHQNWRQGSFIRDRDQVRIFCSSCHGNKTDNLYKKFHKILNAKAVKK